VCDAGYRWSESSAESIQRAEESAQKALSIDESDSGGHALLGNVYEIRGQIEKAIAEAKRAIDLDPNSAGGYLVLAKGMLWSGRFEEAIPTIETAMRLQGPYFSTLMLWVLGYSHSMVGHHEEALTALKKLLERSLKGQYPEFLAHMYLAGANMRMGRVEDAQKHAAEVLRLNPKFSLEYVRKISHFTDPALLERRLEPLRKAGLPD
jgi:adenylate cyclase